MPSRRERAIERYERTYGLTCPVAEADRMMKAYEAELAADLDQLAEVAWGNYSHPDDDASQEEEIAAIRGALKAALEER